MTQCHNVVAQGQRLACLSTGKTCSTVAAEDIKSIAESRAKLAVVESRLKQKKKRWQVAGES